VKTSKAKTIVTTIVLSMALVQAPLFYYYTYGFFKLILLIPYSLTGLVLSIVLLVSIVKQRTTNNSYHIAGLIIGVLIAFPTSFRQDIIEYLDWKLRIGERNKIVNEVKNGTLKPDSAGRYILDGNYFLPISNGGNEIVVTKDKDGFTEVEFNIDHGFLDHYSSLIYSDRTQTPPFINNNTVTTLDAHWYTVHF